MAFIEEQNREILEILKAKKNTQENKAFDFVWPVKLPLQTLESLNELENYLEQDDNLLNSMVCCR